MGFLCIELVGEIGQDHFGFAWVSMICCLSLLLPNLFSSLVLLQGMNGEAYLELGTRNTNIPACCKSTRGGALVFQAGYHARKMTFKTHPNTYFSGMKIDPKYALVHAFLLICPSYPLKICHYDQKDTLFSQFCTFFVPLNDVRAYIAWSWKMTLITWIFLRGWYPTSNTSAPPPRQVKCILIVLCIKLATQVYFWHEMCHSLDCRWWYSGDIDTWMNC